MSNYIDLVKNRIKMNDDIINDKKRNAWEYFRTIISVSNLENNLVKPTFLYILPLNKIHGTNMVCYPFQNKTEIYVDSILWENRKDLCDIQLEHETLHSLSQRRYGVQNFFGHPVLDDKTIYMGLDEATTQMYAEDIVGKRLSSNEDYLFFIKNIMRTLKVLYGNRLIANQYMNSINDFEKTFNDDTDYKFKPFALMVNEIYLLSKKGFYNSLDLQEQERKTSLEKKLKTFIISLINKYYDGNSSIIKDILDEVDVEYADLLELTKYEIGKSF